MSKANPYKIPVPVTKSWYSRVYLASSFWRWRREQFLKVVGFMCERCSHRLAEHIHHLSYDNLFSEPDSDLMALCPDCHRQMHNWPIAANDNKQLEMLFDRMDKKKPA